LQQVVLNLLLNAMEAIKEAGPDPSHEIHMKTERRDPNLIAVSFQDTGTGLPAGDLEKIFEPFWTSKAQGLGLGLSVSRSIISAHGGKLWAQSNAGRGVTFLFTLPVYQEAHEEPHGDHGLRGG
jgi:two-component system sensor kinase FixL